MRFEKDAFVVFASWALAAGLIAAIACGPWGFLGVVVALYLLHRGFVR